MKRLLGAILATYVAVNLASVARADNQDPRAGLDKPIPTVGGEAAFVSKEGETHRSVDAAIKALGGEEKLRKARSMTWKSKGTINFNGNDNEVKSQVTLQGLDHLRSESDVEINGEARKIVSVLNGDKGWRKFGDEPMEMDDAALANAKRRAYLDVIPVTIVDLKGSGFKLEAVADEKVEDKPATGIKVTAPDGKDFRLYFDKESGLPVKLVAKVAGFGGEEFTQETTYKDYKDFDGIKKATKIESKRDGEPFIKSEITEFKVLNEVDPRTFAEPK